MSFTLKVAESIGGANYFIQPPTPNIRNIPAGVACPVSAWAVRRVDPCTVRGLGQGTRIPGGSRERRHACGLGQGPGSV